VTSTGAAILVVDDDESSRYTLIRQLEREGYRDIAMTENGREALERLAVRRFDLVLLDRFQDTVAKAWRGGPDVRR
jgi:CheY-like chemotaxis protein